MTKNYMEPGGDKWVIGGTLEVEDGATITGILGEPLTAATSDALGGVKLATNVAAFVSPEPDSAEEKVNAVIAALIASGAMAAE